MSCIAEYRVGSPIYGANGSLELLKKLNPHLLGKETIELGDVIVFPTALEISRFTKNEVEKPSGYCLATLKGSYYLNSKGTVTHKSKVDAEDRAPSNAKPLVKERSKKGVAVYQNVIEAFSKTSGSSAQWVSQENINIFGAYQVKQGNWWLGVGGEYHIQKYELELNPLFTSAESSPRLIKLYLTSDYEGKRFALGFDLNYQQEAFIYEENAEISLKEVFMVGTKLGVKYKWLKGKKWSSRIGFDLSYPFRGSDSLRPEGSLGYVAFLDLRKDSFMGERSFSTKLYYGLKNFENNQNEQEEEFVGIQFEFLSLNWF